MRLRDGWKAPLFFSCAFDCQSTKSTHRRIQGSNDGLGVGPDAPGPKASL
mgnify:CR=1 FL=1